MSESIILKTIQRQPARAEPEAEDGNGEPARFFLGTKAEQNVNKQGTNHEQEQKGNKDITNREQNCNIQGTNRERGTKGEQTVNIALFTVCSG